MATHVYNPFDVDRRHRVRRGSDEGCAAERPRPMENPIAKETRDAHKENRAAGSTSAGHEGEYQQDLVIRWMPIVVPLLAVLLAAVVYAIDAAVLA